MPYVRTKPIGAHTVVVSFDPPSFDPVATQKAIEPLFRQTDEFKAHEDITARFGELEARRQEILRTARQVARNQAALEEAKKAYTAVVKEQKAVQEKALAHRPRLAERQRQLIEEHGIRFQIRGVEKIDDETSEQLTSKFTGLEPHERLLLDGTVVVDRIGEEYCIKDDTGTWREVKITELGHDIPDGAVRWGEFTREQAAEYEDQKDRERIAALTEEEKASEKDYMLEQALTHSNIKRSEFEIKETADPLADARQWYKDRCKWIENRYQ